MKFLVSNDEYFILILDLPGLTDRGLRMNRNYR
jgi:hypothetical protein